MKMQRFSVFLMVAGMTFPAWAADVQASGLAASPIRPPESGAAAVGKLLTPNPRDRSVPLADPGLSEALAADVSGDGPRPYVRPESGGGVVGLRIPIPPTHAP
jgi:hypothetical protein